MARYSVATTRNNLSSLIDKALAGEEVVITRHGKPTVAMRVVGSRAEVDDAAPAGRATRLEWDKRLEALRNSMPKPSLSYLAIKKLDQADYEH